MQGNIVHIYIPTIHVCWTRDRITDIFAESGAGKVLRVDFVRKNPRDGNNKSTYGNFVTYKLFRQAFIRLDVSNHRGSPFEGFQPNMQIRLHPLSRACDYAGNVELSGYCTNKGNPEYWMCLYAKNPLVDSNISVEDAIANLERLESQLETDEDREIHAYLLKQAKSLRDLHPSYIDVSELNIHQIDNNTHVLANRIAERVHANMIELARSLMTRINTTA